MKRNKIIIVIILILVVLAVVFFAGNRYSTLEDRESNFSVSDTATITKIFIADKSENSVLLTRNNSGWIVNGDYPANTRLVDILLGTIKKLKVKTPVSLSAHDNVVRRMSAISKKVEIYQTVYRINLFDKIKLFEHEKLVRIFYVGDATQNNLGTYMLIEGAERPYIVYIPSFRGYLTERFAPLPDRWKSHVIFNSKLAAIKSVQIEFGRKPEESFKVDVVDARGNYTITALQDNRVIERYDTLKLLNFLTSFNDLRYESRLNNIMSPVKIDSVRQSPSLYEVTLADQNKGIVHLKIFEKKATTVKETSLMLQQIPVDFDRIYGIVNGGDDFVLLQYYVFDKILHPLSYYEK